MKAKPVFEKLPQYKDGEEFEIGKPINATRDNSIFRDASKMKFSKSEEKQEGEK